MATQTTSCPKCKSDDLLVVTLAPKERAMNFHTCRHCENRWWEDIEEGADVSLDNVIDQLAT